VLLLASIGLAINLGGHGRDQHVPNGEMIILALTRRMFVQLIMPLHRLFRFGGDSPAAFWCRVDGPF